MAPLPDEAGRPFLLLQVGKAPLPDKAARPSFYCSVCGPIYEFISGADGSCIKCEGSSLLLYLPVILLGSLLVLVIAFILICRQRRKRMVVAAKAKHRRVMQWAETGIAYLEAMLERFSNILATLGVRGRILISLFQVLPSS